MRFWKSTRSNSPPITTYHFINPSSAFSIDFVSPGSLFFFSCFSSAPLKQIRAILSTITIGADEPSDDRNSDDWHHQYSYPILPLPQNVYCQQEKPFASARNRCTYSFEAAACVLVGTEECRQISKAIFHRDRQSDWHFRSIPS